MKRNEFYQAKTSFMHVLRETHVYVVPFFCAFFVGHGGMAIINYYVQKKRGPS